MPQLNRDKDSLYPPGKLHLWFLGTSALLVGALVWMIAGDFVRPWKSVQRDFYRRQSGLLAIQKEQEEAAVRAGEKSGPRLKELGALIAKAQAALSEPEAASKAALWQAAVDEQTLRLGEADRDIKALKGRYAERRFQYEMAVRYGRNDDARSILAQMQRIGSEQEAIERRRSADVAELARVRGELEAQEKPLRDLQRERDELLSAVSSTATAQDASRAATEEAQWRNLPVLDIVSPTIAIDKVVLDQIHDDFNFATSPKVDMCMTCHRGIDRDGLSERKVGPLLAGFLRARLGEKAWGALEADAAWLLEPQGRRLREWLSGTPSLLDLFPAEKLTKALGSDEDVKRFRDRHLDGASLEDGGKALLSPFAVRRSEWAHPNLGLMVGAESPHPMTKFGCTTCHHGVGRRLDFVRATHSPDSEAQRADWTARLGWQEAELVDFPMLPSRHVQGQCAKCHAPGVEYRPVPEPLVRWTEVAQKDGSKERVRAKAPQPVDGPMSAVDGRWRPEVLERGVHTIDRVGCTGCHLIKDFRALPGFPRATGPQTFDFATPAPGTVTASGFPKVGPDLSHLKDKTSKDFVLRWIEAPTAFRIDTRMPAFYKHVVHRDYVPVPGPGGKPLEQTVVLDPTGRDLAQMDVEELALATFLYDGQKGTRKAQYPEVPAGDPKKGGELFYSMGCYACHLGPDDRDGSALPEPTRKRFERREELPPGPRLQGLGGVRDPKWMYAWLAEPRHYNAATRMPNMRWRDETGADGKTVARTADQLRADVVAYLLADKNPSFLERPVPDPAKGVRWSEEHNLVLTDFWMEWYGKTKPDPKDPTRKVPMSVEEAALEASRLRANPDGFARMLSDVGRGLVRFRGCFGCHNIEGFEHEQPIGKELTAEGSVDVHMFDFGLLGHPTGDMEMTRWSWIERKLEEPRVYDRGRYKPLWSDKLRMPKFNLREEERQAVTSVVLGLVKEPIKPGAKYPWPDDMKKVAAGRAVVERYGCNQCHTLEGRYGVLTAEQLDRGLELWMLPPNLYGQGNRTPADWLFRFLKHPFDVRPGVIQRMPMFRLSDEEVSALVDYFQALAGRKDRLDTDPEDAPLDATPYPEPVSIKVKVKQPDGSNAERELVVRSQVEEAKALFETLNCVKCHLPKGTPGADPNEGASAPPFTLARERLRRAWIADMIHDPQRQIQGTKMPQFWGLKSKRQRKPGDTYDFTFPQFLCGTRGKADATKDDVAESQMATLARYLRWHYAATPAEPAAGK